MAKTDFDRVLALAGLAQAAEGIVQIAETGNVDERILRTAVYSIFQTDPATTIAVYDQINMLATGIALEEEQLQNPAMNAWFRYASLISRLESGLVKNQRLMGVLHEGILQIKERLQHFPMCHDNILAALSDLYFTTITNNFSSITIRSTHQEYLSQERNVNRIRTLLLAGIRSKMLFRQCGGSSWQLLLKRRQLFAACQEVKKQMTVQVRLDINDLE